MAEDTRDKRFGANLRRLRKAAGFTSQESLARVLDVSVFTISRYERGETKPDINGLYALADVLGVKVGKLLPNEEPLNGALAEEARRKTATLDSKVRP